MIIFILILILVFSTSWASVFDKPERGEMWYELPKKEEKKETKKPKKKELKKPKIEKTKAKPKKPKEDKFEFPVRPETPHIIANFLKEPTEENAKEYLKWQAQYFNHLRKIGFVLQNAYKKYGPEAYNVVGYPETILLAEKYKSNGLRDKKYREIIASLKDRLGFIFFYKSTCPFCRDAVPIILYLHQKYGLSIRGVAYDKLLTGLPFKSVVNPHLFIKYQIKQTPSLVAVLEKKDGTIVQGFVGVGYIPADQIEQNILYFLYANGEIKPKDINPNYQFLYKSIRGKQK